MNILPSTEHYNVARMNDEQIAGDLPLETAVGRALRERGWSLATAESCTGGLIGHLITQVPGSSDYYLGGIVSYSDDVKRRLLDVPPATLGKEGAVSEATARAMAAGVRRHLNADVGLSVTGIAGPSGGSAEKPVGLTWIGLSTPEGERTERHVFGGDRASNKAHAAQAALLLVLEELVNG